VPHTEGSRWESGKTTAVGGERRVKGGGGRAQQVRGRELSAVRKSASAGSLLLSATAEAAEYAVGESKGGAA
jgi:hypothetical protein